MKYDFTTVMDRRGMDAIAVDAAPVPEGGRSITMIWACTLKRVIS